MKIITHILYPISAIVPGLFFIFCLFSYLTFGPTVCNSHFGGLWFLLSLLLCTCTSSILKSWIKHNVGMTSSWYEYLKRPSPTVNDELARFVQTADIFSQSLSNNGDIGMPSAHACAGVFIWWVFTAYNSHTHMWVFPICVVSIACRYFKNVHNISQILVGMGIGVLFSITYLYFLPPPLITL